METHVISASTRDAKMKANQLRRELRLPAVMYGHDFDPVNIVVDYQPVRKAYMEGGESTLVDIELNGKKIPALFKAMQFDPVTGKITHVDFYKVNLKEAVVASVPVHLVGTSPAVKDLGGILSQSIKEVEVKALPQEIPHDFELNISAIVDFNTALHVSDIVLPKGVEMVTELELTVATVNPMVEEKVVEATEEGEAAAEGTE